MPAIETFENKRLRLDAASASAPRRSEAPTGIDEDEGCGTCDGAHDITAAFRSVSGGAWAAGEGFSRE